jgi:CCR4-NOT transcriptional complex subunit CAF120
MEGWVRIRLAGQTGWKRFYMVVSSSSSNQALALTRTTSVSDKYPNSSQRNSRRISNLFSRESSSAPLPPKPIVALYSGSKMKDRKAPVLTMREITQAFSVYPEKPELINKSTLMKLEGLMGDEVYAGVMKNREAWMMVMPELLEGSTQAGEMLKWITGEYTGCLRG